MCKGGGFGKAGAQGCVWGACLSAVGLSPCEAFGRVSSSRERSSYTP